MAALRLHALFIGLLCGYALARWAGLCGPAGECLTWSVLAATGGVGVVAQEAAALLFDDGDG
jgi:hypothetical protein